MGAVPNRYIVPVLDREPMSAEETVADIMEKNVLVADLNSSARECAKTMAKRGVSSAVVVQGRSAIGIVTERDLVSKVMADGMDPAKVLIRDIMSTPLITVAPHDTMTRASELMAEYRIRRLVVIDSAGNLSGIVTAGDIARTLAENKGYQEPAFNALARYKEGTESGPYQ
jgi:CBS domain-containing protein